MALRVRLKKNNFENFGKTHEKQDHNFKVSTMKKNTMAMEFRKKTKNKKKIALGTLEKTMKNKMTTLRFWPRRRPYPWNFGKKLRRKRPQLWELWKKP